MLRVDIKDDGLLEMRQVADYETGRGTWETKLGIRTLYSHNRILWSSLCIGDTTVAPRHKLSPSMESDAVVTPWLQRIVTESLGSSRGLRRFPLANPYHTRRPSRCIPLDLAVSTECATSPMNERLDPRLADLTVVVALPTATVAASNSVPQRISFRLRSTGRDSEAIGFPIPRTRISHFP